MGTPHRAAQARKHRSRHARRACPDPAQLRRSARAYVAPEATLISGASVGVRRICEIGRRYLFAAAKEADAPVSIRFRRAAISAIGDWRLTDVEPPTRGEKWPLPATNQRLSLPPCAG